MTAAGAGSRDHQLVEQLAARIAARSGDARALVEAEVGAVAPLATPEERRRLVDEAVARVQGLGALDALLAEPDVDEVLVNSGRDIWVERAGRLEPAGALTGLPLDHLIERILAPIGRRLDRTSPIVDARLPDGSRVCAVIPPIAVDGPTLSIRRFARRPRGVDEFTDEIGRALCERIVEHRCNVVVSGATSSGKTSLLAALLGLVPPGERLLVLEDTAELPIPERHAVRMEARPPTPDLPAEIGVPDLVRAALRLRPDRLIVGEVRGDEVLGLVQALNTGHTGSLTTCHANGPVDALVRLASLVLQAAPQWPLVAIREQLARSIDVIVHVVRDLATGIRRIDAIAEIRPPEFGHAVEPEVRREPVSMIAQHRDGGLVEVGTLTRGRR